MKFYLKYIYIYIYIVKLIVTEHFLHVSVSPDNDRITLNIVKINILSVVVGPLLRNIDRSCNVW